MPGPSRRFVMITAMTALLTAVSGPGLAQTVPEPIAANGAFFALQVRDLDASVAWYRDVFGMRVVMSPPTVNGVAMRLMEGDGVIVELIHDETARPLRDLIAGGQDRRGPIWVHGQFKAGIMVADFDGVIARLRERGANIAIGPFPPRSDQRANAVIRDNEGNYLQVVGGYAPQ